MVAASRESFLDGGGELGDLIRNKDWDNTPLGNPTSWPQSLKTAVRIILTSRQPMFVWWGPELINIYNDAYKSIVGGKHPHCLGQPASEVWKEIWNEVGPRVATVLEHNVGTYDEALLLLMDRNGYVEETYYTFSYSPVPGDDGTTQGIICANTDDTQRIMGERRLHTLRELARQVIDVKSNSEIYEKAIHAIKGNPQDFPFAVLYEVSSDGQQMSLVGKAPDNLPGNIAPGHVDLEKEAGRFPEVVEAIRTAKMTKVTNILKRFGSIPSPFWDKSPDNVILIPILQGNRAFPFALLAVGLNPYRLLDDAYIDFFNLVTDQVATALTNVYALKSERKRAEALAEIDKAKTIFFSNISHEFRTPLTLMLGPLEEMLNKNNRYSEEDQKNLEITHRNAIRLLRLVNSLLDFSRIEAGRIEVKYRGICLGEYTANLASSFRSLIEKAGLGFEVITDVKSPVFVDTDMWERIVLNLLSNAYKYTLQGKITVSVVEQGNEVVVKVSDTGTGIPKNELPHLFERFHRVRNASGRSFEGSGIGLSLVKELVQLNHGSITVESTEGHGSEFIITMPIGNSHLAKEDILEIDLPAQAIKPASYSEEMLQPFREKEDDESEEFEDAGKQRVLVVDDNIDMQQYIRKLLEKKYTVVVAGNGKEALDKLAQQPAELVLTDIMMPVMDGIELLQTIKNDTELRRIPVIMLSARAGEEAKIEGYELGADDYLVKPFSAKELLVRVQSQLRISNKKNHLDQQLRNVFMQAPIAICLLRGPQFVVEIANDRILEIWGKTAETMIDKPVFEGLPEVLRQGYAELLQGVFTTGIPFVADEMPLDIERNGKLERIYIKFVYEPFREQDGSISAIMVIADDITESVMSRMRVEASEMRHKLAMEAARMGSFEWLIPESKFIYSPRLAEIFGHEGDGTFDQSTFSDQIHPDDAPLRNKAHRDAFETGVLFYEARFIWPDASVHWIRLNGNMVYADNGKPSKIYGTVLDISEHKLEAELLERHVDERTRSIELKNKELEESEERYQRMTEEVEDYAILLLDTDGKILNWNKGAQKIKGYEEKEIIGKHLSVFYLPEDQETKLPQRLINEAMINGRATHEGYRIRKDRTVFWASIAITALHDQQNKVIGFTKVTRDLTERKIAEDKMKKYNSELEFQNRELEQFAYIASHDLQEPLRKIQMFSGMLERNLADEEAVRKYFEKINSSAERMSDLIRAVLNYSRLAKTDDQFRAVDPNHILKNVLTDFELLIEEKNAVVVCDPMPIMKAIPLQLNQLFSNLIGNSLKFTESEPKLLISSKIVAYDEIPFQTNLQKNRQYVQLVFSDNGIGFEQKYAAQIFTIFQRLNQRTAYTGTGIGLALCKKIVENHHGFITAVSEPGEGSSFYIYFPFDHELLDVEL